MPDCLSCVKFITDCSPPYKLWLVGCSRFEEVQPQKLPSLEPDAKKASGK